VTLPQPDYTAWRFWADMLVLLTVLANTAYTWWSNRNKRFSGLERRMDHTERVNQELAEKLAARPSCSHHDTFDIRLRKVEGIVEKTDGRMEGVGKSLDIIQQHLMNQGGKS
jgi:hypothetical protein